MSLKKQIKKLLAGILRTVPLDPVLLFTQYLGFLSAALIFFRDWRLQAYGWPQFFKHQINLSRWRFEPSRWSFTARGVYARENMFKGCAVLDLCCGDGTYSRLFFSDIAGKIDAVDNDPHALAYARRYNASPAISYHKIDIVNEGLPSAKYDVVVWNSAICYFSQGEIGRILGKIANAGRPGMKFCGSLPKASGYVDHKTEFEDGESVKRLLRGYFEVVAVIEVDEISATTFYFQATVPLMSVASGKN
jgi:SAM-dependent methyltransferase